MAFDGTACGTLAAIAKLCDLAGFFKPNKIYIAEHADLAAIPAPGVGTKTVSTDITFDLTKFFFIWETAENGANITSAAIGQKGSQIYRNSITVYVPGISRDDALLAMDNVLNNGFVIIAPDTNGNNVILGTAVSPAKVPEGGIQAVKDGENDGITITFENFGAAPLLYTGAITTA